MLMGMYKTTGCKECHFILVCWELWRNIFIHLDRQMGGLTVVKALMLFCQKTWHGSLKSFQTCSKMEELLKVVCRNLMTGTLIQDGGDASSATFQAYNYRRFWADTNHGLHVLNCQAVKHFVKDCMDLCSSKSKCCATLTNFAWELFYLQPYLVISTSENWLVGPVYWAVGVRILLLFRSILSKEHLSTEVLFLYLFIALLP